MEAYYSCSLKVLPCSVPHLADHCAAETFSDGAMMCASQLASGHQRAKPLTPTSPFHFVTVGKPALTAAAAKLTGTAIPASSCLCVWPGFLGKGFVLPGGGLGLTFAIGTGVDLAMLIQYEEQEWECDNLIYWDGGGLYSPCRSSYPITKTKDGIGVFKQL